MTEFIAPSIEKVFVTGAAGFIGSHLVDRLLASGFVVTGYDNMSTGIPDFLAAAQTNPAFHFSKGDLLNLQELTSAMRGVDVVFHFAANADIRFGLQHPEKDLYQNTVGTFHVLEAMRENRVPWICFSSTGSIYGEATVVPTPEDTAFPIQTSLYGASKLAGEGLIAAYATGFSITAHIFRFVSILGERYTHGHVFDFYKQLRANPESLSVLGNGRQKKSYLYVHDCIDAIFMAMQHSRTGVNIFNLGIDDYCEVNESIRWITSFLKLRPSLHYSGHERGWIGDNPFIFLDTQRIRALGWRPKLTIRDGVERTIEWLVDNPWILERRV